MSFQNRKDAAEALYNELDDDFETGKVVALPNDSVLMGRYLADSLQTSFDMVAVEPVKSPETGELLGAVTHGGIMYLNDSSAHQKFSPAFMECERIRLMIEARRFLKLFHLETAPEFDVSSATLIDDGTSDISSIMAGCKHLRRSGVEDITVAVPFISKEDFDELKESADYIHFLFREEDVDCTEFYSSKRGLSEEQFRRCIQG